MKALITDSAVLHSIRPLDIVAYLRLAGWQQTSASNWGQTASMWTLNKENTEYEVLLPLSKDLKDFTPRIAEVLKALETVEQRSQLEIIRDLYNAGADVIRIRVPSSSTADGSIALEDAVKLVQNTKDMVLSAACSAIESRGYFPSRKPNQALEYIDKVKMGQTEQGSFVVTILSPVSPALFTHESALDLSEPFERRVTQTLAKALVSLNNAAAQAVSTGDVEPFRNAIPFGVSANLCDALVGLSSAGEQSSGLEFGFSWAKNRPVPRDTSSRILISSDSFSVISEAARIFKEYEPQEDFELEGIVIKLDRADESKPGTITVLGFVDEQHKKVHIELDDTEYRQATNAHRDRAPISCYGELRKEGRTYRLFNPRKFRVLSLDPEE